MHRPYRVVAGPGSHEIEIKKSRFICTISRATTDEEARAFVGDLKKRYWDANHNCSAYILGERGQIQRSSDDGEPSGTAGIPMLGVLQKQEVTDTVAVVTRYFGGTLLGAGGLIRAYGGAVSATLAKIGLVEIQSRLIVAIEAPYIEAGRLENALRTTEFLLKDVDYGNAVTLTLQTTSEELPVLREWVAQATNGACDVIEMGEEFVEVPVATEREPHE
ncbi:MAG: YigZ family protein [Thermomicrobiales bacterium]